MFGIYLAEQYSNQQFAHDVPDYEIAARREYDARWRGPVDETDPLVYAVRNILSDSSKPRQHDIIAVASERAQEYENQFAPLIACARDSVDQADIGEEYHDCIEAALRVWDELRIRTGFSIGAIMARLAMVPFVLVPSHVSKSHGSAETFSLNERLKDAQRAFVFDCLLSSAALQRSLMEDVLTRHYGARGSLPEKIKSARLPWGLTTENLFQIHKLGNDVLHADRAGRVEKAELLRRLASGLDALRKLIEGVPATQPTSAD